MVLPDKFQSAADRLRHGIYSRHKSMAVECYTGTEWIPLSYHQLQERIERRQRQLTSLGIQAGDPVALLSANSIEWLVSYLSLIFSNTIPVLIDAKLPAAEVQTCLQLVHPAVVCCAADQIHKVSQKYAGQFDIIDLDNDFGLHRRRRPQPSAEWQPREDDLSAIAAILYTSGTSGRCKAVMLTDSNLAAAISHTAPYTSQRVFSILPWSHVFGLVTHINGTLVFCNTLLVATELTPQTLSVVLNEGRPTTLLCVPRLLDVIRSEFKRELQSKRPWVQKLATGLMAVNRLTRRYTAINVGKVFFKPFHQKLGGRLDTAICGGSALAADVFNDLEALGLTVVAGYGLTEVTGPVAITEFADRVAGSVGPPAGRTEIRIEKQGHEQTGEVCIRGDTVMRGYYGDPAATRACIEDGWFHTGDIGYLDERNRLFITGRKKDIIVTAAGYKTNPAAVEQLYNAIAGVEKLAVVGIHDSKAGGEVIHAAVVPEASAASPAGQERIRKAFLRYGGTDIPLHMQIKEVHFFTALPETTTLKIKRHELTGLIQERLAERGKDIRISKQAAGIRQDSASGRIETQFKKLLAERVHIDPDEIDIDEPITRYCVDSLLMVQFLGAIEEVFGCTPEVGQMAANPTLASLADVIRQILKEETAGPGMLPEIGRAAANEKARLSYNEALLFRAIEWDGHGTNPAHKVIGTYEITGDLDVDRLQQAFDYLCRRHEALRTCYVATERGCRRRVNSRTGYAIDTVDLSNLDPGRQQPRLQKIVRSMQYREMDLSKAPLADIQVVTLAPDCRQLLFCLHHLICDGWSMGILAKELSAAYDCLSRGQEITLPNSVLDYSDYAAWQHRCERQGLFDAYLNYWSQTLSGAKPVRLPEKYCFDSNLGRTFYRFNLVLTEDLAAYEKFAAEHGVTPSTVFVSAMQLLMNRLFGPDEHAFYCLFHGRVRKSLQSAVGLIANKFMVSTRVDMDQPVSRILNANYCLLLDHLNQAAVPFPIVLNLRLPIMPLWEVLDVSNRDAKSSLRKMKHLPLVCSINLHFYDAPIPQFTGCQIRNAQRISSREAWWRPGCPELVLNIYKQNGKADLTLIISSGLSYFLPLERVARAYQGILAAIVGKPDEIASTIAGPLLE